MFLDTVRRLRAHPSILLPLVLLYALGRGISQHLVKQVLYDVQCAMFLPQHRLVWIQVFPPPDYCDTPSIQEAYLRNISLYQLILTALSIVMAGPWGWLSDIRGRKYVVVASAAVHMAGDLLICLIAFLPVSTAVTSILLSATITGLGGGDLANLISISAFIADASTPVMRSFWLALSLAIYCAAYRVAALVGEILLAKQLHQTVYATFIGSRLLYLLYAAAVMREVYNPKMSESVIENNSSGMDGGESACKWSFRGVTQLIVNPFREIAGNPSLRRLGGATLLMYAALPAFSGVLTAYCNHTFGERSIEESIIKSTMAAIATISMTILFPIFSMFYRQFRVPPIELSATRDVPSSSSVQNAEVNAESPSETTPLLEPTHVNVPQANNSSPEISTKQELLSCVICLAICAGGAFLLSLSNAVVYAIIATALIAFGSPAMPSLQALVTINIEPHKLGQVLSGFSTLQCVAWLLGNVMSTKFRHTRTGIDSDLLGWLITAMFTLACTLVARSCHTNAKRSTAPEILED
ncbi:MFS general substrate transporter [Wolfiporia cocos MD-104 SS10]|uniref:MFS general substrate transporter n=1 Tax=Wolfiporia cocos (strain MD-104) TaxID=742152 RepID=A0A2H3IXU7_WOLCO|nr:MFS general substrate transporter [Wolfiporia cocos MD-104 SS10]